MKPKSTEYYRKVLREQMSILGMDGKIVEEMNLEFVRVHAMAIVQLCDQILIAEGKQPGIKTMALGAMGLE